MRVLPYGEGAAYIDVEADASPDRAARTGTIVRALRAAFPEADVVAGAGAIAVFGADPSAVREALERRVAEAPERGVAEALERGVAEAPERGVAREDASSEGGRTHEIDVVYDGPDLDDVARAIGATRAELIELHAGRDHIVEVVGFLPGFAYMGPLDPRLVVPRRSAPRPRVPPQSVAIAGAFTGIYPLASPGGWNLLGRSLGPPPFDPSRAEPFLFAAGDRVRFRPVGPDAVAPEEIGLDPNQSLAPPAWKGLDPNQSLAPPVPKGLDPNQSPAAHRGAPAGGPALVVGRAAGAATIQDAGRGGLLSRGMPPSGPLDPSLFAAANRAVGNLPGAAAIELLAGSLVLHARGSVLVSIDGEPPVHLHDAEELRVAEGPLAVRYVAVAGGIDVPVVIGSRATLLSAKIGGAEGRTLRRGDVLPAGLLRIASSSTAASPAVEGAALVEPGPHLERFPAGALDVLLASEWRVSRLTDRTGARLEGATIPRRGPDLAAPVPMRRGAVQVTTDGTPIVLGPDHPTTGGYPVLAVVRASSFGALARKRPGDVVRFRLAGA